MLGAVNIASILQPLLGYMSCLLTVAKSSSISRSLQFIPLPLTICQTNKYSSENDLIICRLLFNESQKCGRCFHPRLSFWTASNRHHWAEVSSSPSPESILLPWNPTLMAPPLFLDATALGSMKLKQCRARGTVGAGLAPDPNNFALGILGWI